MTDTTRLTNCLSGPPLFHIEDDVEETSSKVGQIFRPHRLGVVGTHQRLSAEMNHTSIGRISLSRLRYRADVTISSDPLDTFLLVMMPLHGSAEIRYGKQCIQSTPGLASVVGPAASLSMRWQAECHQLIVRIDREAIEMTCAAHLGHELSRPLEFDLGMNLSETRTTSLQSVVEFLTSTNPFVQSASEFPLMVAQTEQLLICALLSGQPHNYRDELLRPSPIIAPYYVKRCEDYIFAHANEPITIEDLARHTGMSVRSLQTGFQRYRNTRPMVFLKDVRLQHVHDELLCAKLQNRPETVTRVALAWGFSHLGHFTRAYAAKFKELPSQTLRQ
ncbi:AraC family transcriptional regulator [Polaromonas hydrogenivorans]|uniref:AraC family transcriptional regulator n=1 Tax=Polaromonas hydrogenivorans TaxID=335476 RepID=A0AAU7LZ17_9BURK